MKKSSVFTCLLGSFLLISCGASEQIPASDSTELTIDSIALAQKESFELPGLAIGVMKDNKVIYAKGIGVQGLDIKDPMTTKSLFHMASVSKPFVATAMMQLVEAGKVDLDKRLVEYLPYFSMSDERYKDISIRQMLNHTSGIPDVQDYEWDKPQYDDESVERYVKSLSGDQLDFTPGEDFIYSNTAFDILAAVITKASGLTFETYMEKNIFEPVGMINSTFAKPEVPAELATKPHILGPELEMVVSEVYPYNRIHAPSSTLHSNVEDMMLWAQVNLNGGEINGKRIYSPESYDLLTTGQLGLVDRDSVCLSWFKGYVGDYRKLGHSGGDLGYRTYFGFVPEAGVAVVTMGNSEAFQSANVANQILNSILLHKETELAKKPIHLELKKYILTEGIEKCKSVYFKEKENNRGKYDFNGGYLDELGYWLLDREYHQKALEVFLFNVELEPEHAGWHDSVADAYRAMGEKEQAIVWYKKALEIKPDQDFSIRKLEALTRE